MDNPKDIILNAWHHNIENTSVLYNDKEALKFIFSQSEQSLKEVLAIADSIANRAYSLISLTIIIVVAIVGFLAPKIGDFSKNATLNLSCILAIVYFLNILHKLKKNVLPTSYYTIGNQPMFMMIDEMFKEEISNDIRLCHFYISEIEQYQNKINYGTIANTKRQTSLRITIQLLFWFPILFAILYLILGYLLSLAACLSSQLGF